MKMWFINGKRFLNSINFFQEACYCQWFIWFKKKIANKFYNVVKKKKISIMKMIARIFPIWEYNEEDRHIMVRTSS
jgi:hypothetical protein